MENEERGLVTAQPSVKNKLLKINNKEIDEVLADRTWDLGNKVLYDLCRKHPCHKKANEVIAKIWLIGRSYAAAIERRKNPTSKTKGDSFYVDCVAPAIIAEEVDRWIETVTVKNAVQIHYRLTQIFNDITELEKRSLASKYLHFHRPKVFFIYDSRSVAGIRALTPKKIKNSLSAVEECDTEYASFFCRCLFLQKELRKQYGRRLSPRELDKILIYIADVEKK